MPIKVIIDSAIRIPVNGITREQEKALCELFTHDNPKHAKLARMKPGWAKHEPRTIKMWSHKDGYLVLPRGGAGRVREILGRVVWVDSRTTGAASKAGQIPDHFPGGVDQPDLPAWAHQERIVNACAEKQNCIARSPTGSGKTSAAIRLASRVQLPTLIIVYDSGLFGQWERRLQKELGLVGAEIGKIGGGEFRLRPVTIAMQQTLARMKPGKWRRVNDYFGMVICDEVQRFSATTFLKVISKLSAKYRVGISADETRADEKEFLIYDMFGDVAAEVELDELVDLGLVHDVEIRVIPTDFALPWDRRRPDKTFNDVLKVLIENDARNDLILQIAKDEVIAGRQTVLFTHRRDHVVSLAADLRKVGLVPGVMMGGSKEDQETFEKSVEDLTSRTSMIGVGTIMAAGQGLDIPTVSRGIATTPVFRNKQVFGQLRGRMCRKATGKTDAVLYVIWDRKIYGRDVIRNLIEWNRTVKVFHEGAYLDGRAYLFATDRRRGRIPAAG